MLIVFRHSTGKIVNGNRFVKKEGNDQKKSAFYIHMFSGALGVFVCFFPVVI